MKKILTPLFMAGSLLFFAPVAPAQDDPASADMQIVEMGMPALVAGEYGTDIDNENNAGTHTPDYDMDKYLFNTSSVHPVEFNINLPVNPAGRTATLRMDVYDVDTNTAPGNPEIDNVYVNGTKIGVLNGKNGTWGVNIFTIPLGVLKPGLNRVQIRVDMGHPGGGYWATQIDWGIIKLGGSGSLGINIQRGWISPNVTTRGSYINVYAEVSGTPKRVLVYNGSKLLFALSDLDKDRTWSGQYRIPSTWTNGYKPSIFIKAYDAAGAVAAIWPGMTIK